MPWWAILGAKLVLSRVPLGYRAWSALGAFRHGFNHQAEYAFSIYRKHFERAQPPAGFTCLELGPGDALASAVLTRAFGGSRSYQVDVGRYASEDIGVYRSVEAYARQHGCAPVALTDLGSIDDLLRTLSAEYLCEGLASLREIATGSVDFIYSQSCLEHVRLADLPATLSEMKRILAPGGVASHWVDLKDHLGYSLHNLRFSEKAWESDFMADAGFYTNRVRYSAFLEMFRAAGFKVDVVDRADWDELPLARSRMHGRFRDLDDAELKVKGFGVLCT